MEFWRAWIPIYGIYWLFKNDVRSLIDARKNDLANFIISAILQGLYISIIFLGTSILIQDILNN